MSFKLLKINNDKFSFQDKDRLNMQSARLLTCWGFISLLYFCFLASHALTHYFLCNGPEHISTQLFWAWAWIRNLMNSPLLTCLFWPGRESVDPCGFWGLLQAKLQISVQGWESYWYFLRNTEWILNWKDSSGMAFQKKETLTLPRWATLE